MSKKKYGSDLIIDVIKQYDFDYVSFQSRFFLAAHCTILVHHGETQNPSVHSSVRTKTRRSG